MSLRDPASQASGDVSGDATDGFALCGRRVHSSTASQGVCTESTEDAVACVAPKGVAVVAARLVLHRRQDVVRVTADSGGDGCLHGGLVEPRSQVQKHGGDPLVDASHHTPRWRRRPLNRLRRARATPLAFAMTAGSQHRHDAVRCWLVVVHDYSLCVLPPACEEGMHARLGPTSLKGSTGLSRS